MKIEKTNSTFQKQFDIKDEQINVIKEDPTELDSENKENLKNIINCEYLALQKVSFLKKLILI